MKIVIGGKKTKKKRRSTHVEGVPTKVKEKKRPFPRGTPVVKAPKDRSRGTEFPGTWIVNQLAKSNPHVRKVRDALYALPRDEVAARLAWIYCTILGLTNLERQ